MWSMAKADLDRVRRAYRKLVRSREEADAAIRQARDAGETLEDIGRAAGLTRQAIYKALRDRL